MMRRLAALAPILALAACHQGATRPAHPTRSAAHVPAQPREITVTGVESSAQAPSYFRSVARAIALHYTPRTGGKTAVVLFTVNRDGHVQDINLSVPSGDPGFDQGALDAVHATRADRMPDILLGTRVALRAVFTPAP